MFEVPKGPQEPALSLAWGLDRSLRYAKGGVEQILDNFHSRDHAVRTGVVFDVEYDVLDEINYETETDAEGSPVHSPRPDILAAREEVFQFPSEQPMPPLVW